WNRDLLIRNDRGHIDVPRLIEGNVALQVFTIVTKVPKGVNIDCNSDDTDHISMLAMTQRWPIESWQNLKARALHQAERLSRFADNSNGLLRIIHNATELEEYVEQRRDLSQSITATILGVEGAHCLEGDLNNIDRFYDAGIRMIAPVHFFDNDMGGS